MQDKGSSQKDPAGHPLGSSDPITSSLLRRTWKPCGWGAPVSLRERRVDFSFFSSLSASLFPRISYTQTPCPSHTRCLPQHLSAVTRGTIFRHRPLSPRSWPRTRSSYASCPRQKLVLCLGLTLLGFTSSGTHGWLTKRHPELYGLAWGSEGRVASG